MSKGFQKDSGRKASANGCLVFPGRKIPLQELFLPGCKAFEIALGRYVYVGADGLSGAAIANSRKRILQILHQGCKGVLRA